MFDESYVTRLQQSDPETEAHFASHFSRVGILMLRRRLRSPEMVQDACQEAMLRCLRYFRSGKGLQNPERLAGFVHAMCNNVALEMIRAGTRHPQLAANTPEATDDRIDFDRSIVNEERKRVVKEVLAQLPPKDRDLLQHAFLEEEDRDELCRRFGTTEEYLRVLLHRARTRFRNILSNLTGRPEPGDSGPRSDTFVKRKSQAG